MGRVFGLPGLETGVTGPARTRPLTCAVAGTPAGVPLPHAATSPVTAISDNHRVKHFMSF
jgi:hypothetical protein